MVTEACEGKLKSIATWRLEDPRLGTVCSGQKITGCGNGFREKGL